jgi:hypothetical protein
MNGHHQARTPCRKSAPIADILAAGNHYTGGATKGSAIGWCPPGIQRRGHPDLSPGGGTAFGRSQSCGFRDCYWSAAQLGSKMNAFVFQVTCVCAVRRFLLLADFVAKGIAAKPPGRAAALERRVGDACAIPKNRGSIPHPMVDGPTSAALHGRRVRSPSSRKHRTAGCRPQKGDRFARRGARRSKDTRGSGVSAAVYPASATGAKRGSPSLALDAALVHTS